MPDGNDPNDLSEEDLAALSEYESSEEGQAAGEPEPESRAARVANLFWKTTEMEECRRTADSIKNNLNPEDTVAVKIDVPREFLRLTQFLEKKRATAAGVEPLPPPQVLNRILLNELHDQLHGLITGPARFDYYRDLWNHFCDAQGAPELKIADPSADEKGTATDGPF